MSTTTARYRFGPLERRSLVGGIRVGQAAVLGAGLLGAAITIDLAPSAAGAFVCIVVLALTAALSALRLDGRTVDEWGPIALSFALRRTGRRRAFRSSAPLAGVRARVAPPAVQSSESEPDPPPALRDVRLVDIDHAGTGMSALSERHGRRLTAVLACRVASFELLDPDAQQRRLDQWGLVLAGAAATEIRRIQWIERTAPAPGDELAQWLHRAHDPEIARRGEAIVESYLELISASSRVAQSHEILIAVQVDAGRGGGRGRTDASRALVEATESVARGLEAAEVTVLGALRGGQLARLLRTAFDPYARAELAALRAVEAGRDELGEAGSWPVAAMETWDQYRCDGAHHATYWIGGWPKSDVSPMFMNALLGHASAVRTVAVTFEPIAPERSARDAEAAVTRDHADRELRRRFGQSETARQRHAQESAARREAELAAGHGEVRLTGFITVSGRDQDELGRATSEVLEHAARARLELHRMYGQQADAFTFTLPLARGLR